jgi:hypothetical protein
MEMSGDIPVSAAIPFQGNNYDIAPCYNGVNGKRTLNITYYDKSCQIHVYAAYLSEREITVYTVMSRRYTGFEEMSGQIKLRPSLH